MVLTPANRLYIRRILRLRVTRVAVCLFLLFNFIDVLRIHHNLSHGDVQRRSNPPGPGPSRPHERIYIASMHFNNGAILKSHWNDAVIGLTETFGPKNVFVSIFESGSWDDSKEVLRELDRDLERRGVPHRVEVSDVTHQDELDSADKGDGWIDTPRKKKELRRIPYLSRLRNKTIKDLLHLHKQGVEFDKVLFLNDVVFTVEDVLTLMDTNGVVMPAEPFVSSTKLRFRGVPDSLANYHLEGSECCLIHADNPLSRTLGVYLNPKVKTLDINYIGRGGCTIKG
ncbi:polysaccharide export protein (CAP59) [Metarhizium acridum CQMa 102]|uniref:Polysaccharide export protein (CAP59) n=1 Tax=Metarhizium acridum (strain CQMa 102) TaxID=655827 RepID=E9DZL9_METAQ|nr:polysaccharide export protein (CAP59) [Metarhizium acridum CQMa 102]EFY90951.1 polysaccharide export protein (CAP59) [Metarhizium acridum CQMa 102]